MKTTYINEKVIVLLSVPISLLIVLLFAVFVLAHDSGNEQAAMLRLWM